MTKCPECGADSVKVKDKEGSEFEACPVCRIPISEAKEAPEEEEEGEE